jgi:hypothetical protein
VSQRLEALPGLPGSRAGGLGGRATWFAYWVGLSVLSSAVAYKANWVPRKSGSIYDISSGFSPYVRSLIEGRGFVDDVSLVGARRTTMRLPADAEPATVRSAP